VSVSDVGGLTSAIAAAQPGDEILVAPGAYTITDIPCTNSGTSAQPIVVRAATPLASQLRMAGTNGFTVSGAYWRFDGFDVLGVCGVDAQCEHAFHVVGAADGFALVNSRLVDLNSPIEVDPQQIGAAWVSPNQGFLAGNDVHDTRARDTATPVAKISIAAGDGWVVSANYVHDFQRADGADARGVVLAGGGHGGILERNLVVCTHDWVPAKGSLAVGLSVGGGGTPPQACAPAFDAGVPCAVEHTGAILRNDVVVACSDLGVAILRGAASSVWFDTIIDTGGVEASELATTGEARGLVMGGAIRTTQGASFVDADNFENVSPNQFLLMYRSPLDGDLRAASPGSVALLVGKGPTIAQVTDDYCARARAVPYDMGALQASLGDCDTVPPPAQALDGGTDAGDDGPGSGPGQGDAADAAADASLQETPAGGGGGCGCRTANCKGGDRPYLALPALILPLLVRFGRKGRRLRG